jgi:hypothetical protein
LADSEVRQEEGDDDVRRQMKADYSKRKQVPQSVLLSHAAHLPKVESEEESVSKLAGFTISSGEPVRWVRDFRAVLDNVYDLPADASVSSTTEEGRLFLDKGTPPSSLPSAVTNTTYPLFDGAFNRAVVGTHHGSVPHQRPAHSPDRPGGRR